MKIDTYIRQGDLFEDSTGEELANTGLSLAVENAERKEKDWSKRTWQLFLWWLRRKMKGEDFMIEDFRNDMYANDLVTPPPSERAYGFISKRALKEGWICFSRIDKTKNKKSHATPVNVWKKI